jgi:hypothetical protein
MALEHCWDDGAVLRDRRRGERAIPRRHNQLGVVDRDRRRKVDGVVATQPVVLGKRSRSPCKGLVESDHVQLIAQLVDRPHGSPQLARVDPAAAMRCRGGSACFGVDQLAGRDGLCAIPQLDRNI